MPEKEVSIDDNAKLPVTIDLPLDWVSMNLNQQARNIRFVQDKEGNIWGMPVVLVDPSLASLTTASGDNNFKAVPTMILRDPITGYQASVEPYSRAELALNWNTGAALDVNAVQFVWDPITQLYTAIKNPNQWKTATAAAATGTTDVWTPAAGKKFKLLGGVICMSGLIAAAATRTINLVEETLGAIGVAFGVTVPVLGCNVVIPFTLGPLGYTATTADKKLQVTTAGATYTTGQDVITVWGTEV